MKFNVIGAGRLGKNIASALSSTKLITLDSICNQSIHSSRQACDILGMGTALGSLLELPPVDVTWICSNDDAITSIVSVLAKNSVLKPNSIVIHCSGALNSTVLNPLKEQYCSVASFHPLKAFKTGYLDAQAFNQTSCVIEGDSLACTWLSTFFEGIGTHLVSVPPESKVLYHAAATIASNYLIALANSSEELLLQAGISHNEARSMICNLMQGSINNLKHTDQTAQALTGPISRGDAQTLSLHLEAIQNPAIKELYIKAGLATLPMTQLSDEKKQLITSILKS